MYKKANQWKGKNATTIKNKENISLPKSDYENASKPRNINIRQPTGKNRTGRVIKECVFHSL
jgi:hypothetical protein